MWRYGGYAGRVLYVDLTRRKVRDGELRDELVKGFIGGTGLAAVMLWEMVDETVDPLSPDNPLIIATGPVNGTLFPPAGRYAFVAKSPLTGIWGEAHVGGHFGPELKYAGYDFVVVTGRSNRPVYLFIDDEYVSIRDAGHLWGRTTFETTDMIRKEIGDASVRVACIGQAGENLVRFASIISDYYRAAARCGLGAVMGSKRLKAVAVRGSRDVEVADPDKFWEVFEEAFFLETRSKWGLAAQESLGKYGTPNLVEAEQAIGRLPTKNHYTGVFDGWEDISGERMRREFRVRRESCFACGIQCKFISRTKSGKYPSVVVGGPEYETVMAYGSNCLVRDLEAVIYANYLSDAYGVDTLSCGKTISFAMECYEKGILTKEKAGFEIKWEDPEVVIKLIKMITFRQGIGNLLAEGTKRAAEALGGDAWRYAMHVKGLEISGQDARAQKSVGVTHATGARGADHLRSLSCLEELGYPDVAIERFGPEIGPVIMDRLSEKYKGLVVKDVEDLYAVTDSLIVCKYGTMWPPIYYFDFFAKLLPPLTGIGEWGDPRKIREIGERIVNMKRAFNAREGIARKDDRLPERFTKEPMPDGPAKGQVVNLDVMLDEYYRARGWDVKTGLPTRRKLEELGLKTVADKLERAGKLPS